MQELLKENEIEIPQAILLDAENLGKDIACAGLPTVEKFLLNAKNNLEKNGMHPIKLAVVKWLLQEVPKAQAVLGCPSAPDSNNPSQQ